MGFVTRTKNKRSVNDLAMRTKLEIRPTKNIMVEVPIAGWGFDVRFG